MAKTKSPDEAVFAGLQKAYDALPNSLPLCGAKSIFTAKQAELARKAVQDGYLSIRKELKSTGKGKKQRQTEVEHGVLTEAGIRKVEGAKNPKAVLEALLPAVQSLGRAPASPPPPDGEAFRAALRSATAECVNVIQTAFGELEHRVLEAVAPQTGSPVDPGPVLTALRLALDRVQAPTTQTTRVVESPSPTPSPAKSSTAALADEIVSFVTTWARQNSVGCQFDDLWEHLRKRHSDLSIGTFQDTLRNLREAGRIRLSGWPRMLDDLPKPELALFVSNKVMYHAHPPH